MVFVLGLALAAYLAASYWRQERNSYHRDTSLAACELRSGQCRMPLDHGWVEFSISPPQVPLMQTLALTVRVDGLDVAGVQVDIRGLNMDMGFNRVRLQRLDNGAWRAETILPVCSQRRMRWEAAVQLDGARKVELPFTFETLRP